MISDQLDTEEIKWLYKILAKIDFFSEIPINDTDKIINKFFKESFPADKVLIEQGAKSEALYIIKHGCCKVCRKKGIFGKIVDVATLNEGDFFGEMSLLFNFPAFCSVKTVAPTDIFVYLKSDFLELLKSNNALLGKIKHIAEIRRYEDFKK